MHTVTVTLNSQGPQTRAEVFDTLKAAHIILGRDPVEMTVPLSTYMAWSRWDANEKGRTRGAPDPLPADHVPEQLFGVSVRVGHRFMIS